MHYVGRNKIIFRDDNHGYRTSNNTSSIHIRANPNRSIPNGTIWSDTMIVCNNIKEVTNSNEVVLIKEIDDTYSIVIFKRRIIGLEHAKHAAEIFEEQELSNRLRNPNGSW